jgi:large subunit ribosomal protein L4
MALLSKFQDGQATILDEISVDAPKTKTVVNVLKALGFDGVNCLLAVDGPHGDLWKSARNIATLQMLQATDLNAYALLHQRQFIVTAAAMDRLLGKNSDGNGEDAESE